MVGVADQGAHYKICGQGSGTELHETDGIRSLDGSAEDGPGIGTRTAVVILDRATQTTPREGAKRTRSVKKNRAKSGV